MTHIQIQIDMDDLQVNCVFKVRVWEGIIPASICLAPLFLICLFLSFSFAIRSREHPSIHSYITA